MSGLTQLAASSLRGNSNRLQTRWKYCLSRLFNSIHSEFPVTILAPHKVGNINFCSIQENALAATRRMLQPISSMHVCSHALLSPRSAPRYQRHSCCSWSSSQHAGTCRPTSWLYNTHSTNPCPLTISTSDVLAARKTLPPTSSNSSKRHTTASASATATAPSTSSSTPPPADLEATCQRATLPALPGPLAEELGDMLLTLGAQSVMFEEHRPPGAPEQAIFDDGVSRLWNTCDLVVHFPLEADVSTMVLMAAHSVGMQPYDEPLQYRVEHVANEAWVEQIKASYVPLQIADDMWVIPEWSQPEDPDAINIVLQPGVAFGTGEHPTTRLCLQQLRSLAAWGRLSGAAVCDYGTGSGVLALAALKLGASRAVGTDIDLLAVKSARRNAALNGLHPPAFTALLCGAGIHEPQPITHKALDAAASPLGDETAEAGEAREGEDVPDGNRHAAASASSRAGGAEDESAEDGVLFDLVVANILRGPLVELQPRLASYVRPGGRLLLSGLLVEQADEVMAAYGEEFGEWELTSEQQWAALSAVKR